MDLATTNVHADWMGTTAEGKVGQLVHIIARITSEDIQKISAECHDALSSAWAALDAKIQIAALRRDGQFDDPSMHDADNGWMETSVEGKISQLLHIEEHLGVDEIQRLAPEPHFALTTAWAALDANIHASAPERCKRIDEAATQAQESLDCLHDGDADTIGMRLGITDEDFV